MFRRRGGGAAVGGKGGYPAIVDWQQQSGYLYASGDLSSVLVWDVDREVLANNMSTESEHAVTAMSASQLFRGQLATGFADGSVRIFDIRAHQSMVCCTTPHPSRVVGVSFQPQADATKLVSASSGGDIQLLDVRRGGAAYVSVEAHKGSLTALAVHRHAQVMATGSAKQHIKVGVGG